MYEDLDLDLTAGQSLALVSGFEQQEAAAVGAELARCGGALCEARSKGDWALLVVRGKLVGGV